MDLTITKVGHFTRAQSLHLLYTSGQADIYRGPMEPGGWGGGLKERLKPIGFYVVIHVEWYMTALSSE